MRLLITILLLTAVTVPAQDFGLQGNYGLPDDVGMSDDVGLSIGKYMKQYAKHRQGLEHVPVIPEVNVEAKAKVLKQWQTIIEKKHEVEAVKWDIPENLKAVSELTITTSKSEREDQNEALQWYRDRGYNAVVVTWRDETVDQIRRTCKRLHTGGWIVIMSYSPKNKSGAWVDPGKMKRIIRRSADHVDAVLPIWRKTSGPHWETQRELYAKCTADLVRSEAPEMPLLGEVFVRHGNDPYITGTSYASAMVLLNAGVRGMMPKYIMENAREDLTKNLPILYTVIGPEHGYQMTDFQWRDIHKSEERIRERALNGGASGTITFSGNGYNGRGLINRSK